ncbi:MAG TPA: hypothetical protein VKV26_11890 [Dehalococcoidia bacterium]|nr:hypothetical protein [Dehalococcoidia bacterium]
MYESELRAWLEQRFREQVLYPAAERRQRMLEDWQRAEQHASLWRGPRRRLGAGLVACGAALAALGRRLQDLGREPIAPAQ